MSDSSSPLVLRNFSGSPEITSEAQALKTQAIALAVPIKKVETEGEQSLAVTALQALKAISKGMESTRKAVKAPVLELGKRIDCIAAEFLLDSDREEMRLQGLINHYQRKQLELKRAEEDRIQREATELQRLKDEAEQLRLRAAKVPDADFDKARSEVAKIEARVFETEMAQEISPAPLAVIKPRGLVVKSRLNFQIEDAFVFCEAYPQFFSWNAETETLKLKRRDILDELNREDGKGIFHRTPFPEELPDEKGSRLAKPPGMRIFEETKSHVR